MPENHDDPLHCPRCTAAELGRLRKLDAANRDWWEAAEALLESDERVMAADERLIAAYRRENDLLRVLLGLTLLLLARKE